MQARVAGEAKFINFSYSRLQTMAVFWRLVRMAPMPAKMPRLFYVVDSMPKLLLDVIERNVGQ
jgi:hypothetical protein